jgi:magnesium-transporting ATPase (P-type)
MTIIRTHRHVGKENTSFHVHLVHVLYPCAALSVAFVVVCAWHIYQVSEWSKTVFKGKKTTLQLDDMHWLSTLFFLQLECLCKWVKCETARFREANWHHVQCHYSTWFWVQSISVWLEPFYSKVLSSMNKHLNDFNIPDDPEMQYHNIRKVFLKIFGLRASWGNEVFEVSWHYTIG